MLEPVSYGSARCEVAQIAPHERGPRVDLLAGVRPAQPVRAPEDADDVLPARGAVVAAAWLGSTRPGHGHSPAASPATALSRRSSSSPAALAARYTSRANAMASSGVSSRSGTRSRTRTSTAVAEGLSPMRAAPSLRR